MLVEREVKDRYLSASFSTVSTAADVGVNLIEAGRPQKLRVRMLKYSVEGGAIMTSTMWMILAVVPDSLGPGSITTPTVTGTPVDIYEPASNVIWSSVVTVSESGAVAGPNIVNDIWWGDGRIIEMKTGDAIYLIMDADNGSIVVRTVLDVEILS